MFAGGIPRHPAPGVPAAGGGVRGYAVYRCGGFVKGAFITFLPQSRKGWKVLKIFINCSVQKNKYADCAESFFEKNLRYFEPSAQSALFREIRVQFLQSLLDP
jgi:hypothetical protein